MQRTTWAIRNFIGTPCSDRQPDATVFSKATGHPFFNTSYRDSYATLQSTGTQICWNHAIKCAARKRPPVRPREPYWQRALHQKLEHLKDALPSFSFIAVNFSWLCRICRIYFTLHFASRQERIATSSMIWGRIPHEKCSMNDIESYENISTV